MIVKAMEFIMFFCLSFLITVQSTFAESKLTLDRMSIARERLTRINVGAKLVNQWNLANNELSADVIQVYEHKYKNENEHEREIKELTHCEYMQKVLSENKNDLTTGQQGALLLIGAPIFVSLADALSVNLEIILASVGEFFLIKGKFLSGAGLLVYSNGLGDGTLTAYYRTSEGFTDFLKKSEKEKEWYMQQDSKLYDMAIKFYSYLKNTNRLAEVDNEICVN